MASIFELAFKGPKEKQKNRAKASLENNIEAVFQSRVGLSDGLIHGAESLVRWKEIDVKVSPLQLVDALTKANMSDELAKKMIAKSASLIALSEPFQNMDVFINICPSQLETFDVFEAIHRSAEDYDIAPNSLHIELTETGNIFPVAIERLNELRDHGHQIEIDDFGTGESTFERVTKLPVTGVKVDKSLIDLAFGDGMHAEPFHPEASRTLRDAAKARIEMLANYCEKKNLSYTAEGIENEYMAEQAEKSGFIFGQGYHFDFPGPVEEFIRTRFDTGFHRTLQSEGFPSVA